MYKYLCLCICIHVLIYENIDIEYRCIFANEITDKWYI